MDLGGRAVQEVDGSLVTYVPPPPDPEELLEATRCRIRAVPGAGAAELHWRWQRQEDWEVFWRWGLGPRRITPRVVVTPSWEPVEPEPGEVLVTLDPGMAFGTAEHPTTRGCLRLMEPRVSRGARIADVGAGSGILSIVAARLGAGDVFALEMDELACHVCRENVVANGVGDQIRVIHTEVREDAPLAGRPFQGVVANLQSHLHRALLTSFRTSITREGWLVLGGILREERDEVVAAASRAGFALVEEDQEEEWWSGAFRAVSLPQRG
jgi:ribosomal protein L11 methyltransferase